MISSESQFQQDHEGGVSGDHLFPFSRIPSELPRVLDLACVKFVVTQA
jgi:hypothetical protein